MRSEIKTDLDSIVKVIRENTDVPVQSDSAFPRLSRQRKWQISRMTIVGSAIINFWKSMEKRRRIT